MINVPNKSKKLSLELQNEELSKIAPFYAKKPQWSGFSPCTELTNISYRLARHDHSFQIQHITPPHNACSSTRAGDANITPSQRSSHYYTKELIQANRQAPFTAF